jgi:tRNA pseudouridine38-40 synthase
MTSSACLSELQEANLTPVANRVALVVEYEGTRYYGFQWQDDHPTIQQQIEKAILSLTGERLRVVAASRTDTGTHALGQVVSFRTDSKLPLNAFVTGLNHFLPKDVSVKSAHNPAANFHVQKSAVSRVYEYHIVSSPTRSPLRERFAYVISGRPDIDLMNSACAFMLGEHDFASFTSDSPSGRSTVRRVYRSEVSDRWGELVFTMEASSFLMHQIRNTVGALIRVGLERMSVPEFYSIMEQRMPGLAGPKAPACGLHLVRVNYPRPIEEETNEDL